MNERMEGAPLARARAMVSWYDESGPKTLHVRNETGRAGSHEHPLVFRSSFPAQPGGLHVAGHILYATDKCSFIAFGNVTPVVVVVVIVICTRRNQD